MKINADWHKKHRMPANASLVERINWHIAHVKHCACRPMPDSIVTALKGNDFKACNRGHKYPGSGPCPICWQKKLPNPVER